VLVLTPYYEVDVDSSAASIKALLLSSLLACSVMQRLNREAVYGGPGSVL
jgi:hypothetical protein